MNQFITFIRKEFYHVFRDSKTLLMLFGLPIVQIVLFGFALSNEIRNAKIAIFDQAKDQTSQQIINRFAASRYFSLQNSISSASQIEAASATDYSANQDALQSGIERSSHLCPWRHGISSHAGLRADDIHFHC